MLVSNVLKALGDETVEQVTEGQLGLTSSSQETHCRPGVGQEGGVQLDDRAGSTLSVGAPCDIGTRHENLRIYRRERPRRPLVGLSPRSSTSWAGVFVRISSCMA